MYEVTCLDLKGNTINSFTQWDVDQKIVISLKGCDENYLSIAPEVHFCNVKSSDALVVRSTVTNRDTITAEVPNKLLQQPYPLLVYVYLTDADDVSSQKTILRSEIPIRQRAEPSDYLFIENIERITAEMIKEEIEADIKSIQTETINTINSEKNDAISLIEQAENEITSVKNDAYTFITNTKDEAIASIENTKSETEKFIETEKAEFESVGQGIIADTEKIKTDTQTIYENTVDVSNETAEKIESDIRAMMIENGMEIQITDDGNGICTMSIVVAQSNSE